MKKLLALISLSFCLAANAAVLFDRPHDGTGALIPSSWFAPDGLDSDAYAYDTFTVTNSGACAEIDWQGGAGSGLKFTVTIFDPAHPYGNPQVAVTPYKNYNVGTNFTQTMLGTFNGTPIYNFKYVPSTPVQLYSGTNYTMLIEDTSGTWSGIARGGGGNHIEFYTGLAMFLSSPGDTAFKIIASDAPTNTIIASVTPVGAGTVTGAGDYPSNTVAVLVAAPNAGWGFSKWTQNGTQVSTAATYNFTVKSNRTLVANFVPAYTVTTAVAPLFGGSITGSGTFNSNSTVTVQAVPASGFQFVNWTDSGNPVSTATNYAFTITANHALVANFAPLSPTAIFDFDTGSPALSVYQGMPASQSNRQVTAYFSAPAGSWSIQNLSTSVIPVNPKFTGNMLYPSTWWSVVQIEFSSPLTDFAMDFTTGEVSSEYNTAATMRVTAYTNSTATPAVGSGTSQGSWISGGYPEGHLAYHSATPFTIVTIDVAPVGGPSGLFFADNLVVQRFIPQNFAINASVTPANAGTVSGIGSFPDGTTTSLVATATSGFIFANWTENGNVVSVTPAYAFTVSSNRTLVANFITNSPPVAFGGSFFQLTGQPLAINLADLMLNDYDPDGGVVTFVSVSATTNGHSLTTNATQIIVPANTVADRFTYTISDANGGTATGTAHLAIITSPASQAQSPDLTIPGEVTLNASGVPWYYYEVQRATNAAFTGSIQIWSVQAAADGSIAIWDNFPDLASQPSQAFYRLVHTP